VSLKPHVSAPFPGLPYFLIMIWVSVERDTHAGIKELKKARIGTG